MSAIFWLKSYRKWIYISFNMISFFKYLTSSHKVWCFMMSDLEQLKQCQKNSLIAKVSISYEYIYHSNYEYLCTMIFFKYFFKTWWHCGHNWMVVWICVWMGASLVQGRSTSFVQAYMSLSGSTLSRYIHSKKSLKILKA